MNNLQREYKLDRSYISSPGTPKLSKSKSPDKLILKLERNLAETTEKLEITYEVNNILKMQM